MFFVFINFSRSRQLAYKKPLFRMTRQKKILFIVLVLLITLFTLIIIFSRLGNLSTEDDPALDPMNNPNIRVQWRKRYIFLLNSICLFFIVYYLFSKFFLLSPYLKNFSNKNKHTIINVDAWCTFEMMF